MYIEALCAIKYKKNKKNMLIVNCKTTQESLSDIKCSNVTESIHCGHVRFHESALSTVVVIYVITEILIEQLPWQFEWWGSVSNSSWREYEMVSS